MYFIILLQETEKQRDNPARGEPNQFYKLTLDQWDATIPLFMHYSLYLHIKDFGFT